MNRADPTATTTTTGGPHRVIAPAWQRRTELDLIAQQLRGIEQFNQACRAREAADAVPVRLTREMRLDATRSLQVLRRQHDALVAHAHEQLRATGSILRDTAQRRVVLGHRNERYTTAIALVLREAGVIVVAQVDNGADAVGLLIAEQPDLVLVEDLLAMGGADDVLREAHRYAPATLVAVQAAHDDRTAALLRGGAAAVILRRTGARDVAGNLLRLITTQPAVPAQPTPPARRPDRSRHDS